MAGAVTYLTAYQYLAQRSRQWVIVVRFTALPAVPVSEFQELCPMVTTDEWQDNLMVLCPDDKTEALEFRDILFRPEYQGDVSASAYFISPEGRIIAELHV